MLNTSRKKSLFVIFSLFYMVMATGVAFGYSITIDAKDDAGTSPFQDAYLQFSNSSNINPLNPWETSQDVYDYANSTDIQNGWSLYSAGNIWSSDKVVGDLLNLEAGTYRITPAAITEVKKAFARDVFGWSDSYGHWWWEMQIFAHNVYVDEQDQQVKKDYYSYVLGSNFYRTSENDAYDDNKDVSLELKLADDGWLNFWIWDTNTIDNTGALSVNITAIPEPSTIFLLLSGLLTLTIIPSRLKRLFL